MGEQHTTPESAYPTAPTMPLPPLSSGGATEARHYPLATDSYPAPPIPAESAALDPNQDGRAPSTVNTLAIIALILGIVGWIVPVLMPVGAIAAVVCGHLALKHISQEPGQEGRPLAVAGLVLGYIPIAIIALAMIVAIIAGVVFLLAGFAV